MHTYGCTLGVLRGMCEYLWCALGVLRGMCAYLWVYARGVEGDV